MKFKNFTIIPKANKVKKHEIDLFIESSTAAELSDIH